MGEGAENIGAVQPNLPNDPGKIAGIPCLVLPLAAFSEGGAGGNRFLKPKNGFPLALPSEKAARDKSKTGNTNNLPRIIGNVGLNGA
ncbi:MAG: hypothetical protein IJ189_10205, partial [Clostridia bacterium]|nr:hypothetical protein [Clostridia bacterium]